MNGEIKYKAWDSSNKKMIDWEEMRIEKDEDEREFSIVVFDDGVGEHFEEFPLLQYTGMQDMHGNEICESDVLKIYPRNKEHYGEFSIFHVCKTLSAWGWNFTWLHVSGYECCTHIMERYDERFENVEIVGNAYENPDLFKA